MVPGAILFLHLHFISVTNKYAISSISMYVFGIGHGSISHEAEFDAFIAKTQHGMSRTHNQREGIHVVEPTFPQDSPREVL